MEHDLSERRIGDAARRHTRSVTVRLARFLEAGARPIASVHDVFRADLRRSRRAFWARRSRWTGAAVAYAGVAIVVGVLVHWSLAVVLLAPFAVEALRLRWRSRPGWGRDAGLPPGTVGIGTEPMLRFDALASAARRYGPVFKSNYFRQPMVCIADLGLGTEFLRANAQELGHRPNSFNANIPGGAIRWAPEPRHTELRRLFARAMSAGAVDAWGPVFDDTLREVLGDAASSPSGALPRTLLREAADRVCTQFLFGVFPDDPERAELRAHLERVDVARPYPLPPTQQAVHLDAATALIRSRLARPVAGRPVSVVQVLAADPARPLDDPGVMRNLVYLGIGPRNDLAGLLTWMCWYLAHNPHWLVAARDAPMGDDLPGRIVSETLRLDQSEYLFRFAERDLEVAGFRVPADWAVRVCIREIHRDPRYFADPMQFDPDRFVGAGPGPDVYAPLGVDHHACLGEPLARAVGARFVRTLADGYDVEVLDDGRRILSENGHWAPSERFRVRLVTRRSG